MPNKRKKTNTFSVNDFLKKNQVFLSGLSASLLAVLTQYIAVPNPDYKIIGYAAAMTVLSYFGDKWRGKGFTIASIAGSIAIEVSTQMETHHITASHLVLGIIIAALGCAAPPLKPDSYETNPVIKRAKTKPK